MYIPVAVVIQIIAPLVLFPGFNDHHPVTNQHVLCIISFALGTIVFTEFLLFSGTTLIPLLVMAGFTVLSLFVVRLVENRIQRQYRGAP